jgi:hypothetical protein
MPMGLPFNETSFCIKRQVNRNNTAQMKVVMFYQKGTSILLCNQQRTPTDAETKTTNLGFSHLFSQSKTKIWSIKV